MKVRATKYLHDWNSGLEGFLGGLERHIGRNACTPASCSCHMCGNPRKHFGELTIAEQSDKEFYVNTDGSKVDSISRIIVEDAKDDSRNYINTEPDRWEDAEEELILR